ncbi:MAG: nucleotide exchange factor GrpE [Chloroflexi bacterium]|nr:nucleotide exchange factor GrpE [Chloroflexota bacterium]
MAFDDQETTRQENAAGQPETLAQVAELEKALAEQTAKAAEYLQQWQRAAADFSNYRKRQERDQQQMTKWANASLLRELLPVLDDLQRALSDLPAEAQSSGWGQGVELVERKMRLAFQKSGLEQVVAEPGVPFDPTVHEAVFYEESADYPEGAILQVLRQGYKLGDTVLRPAMVKVAKAA